MPSPGLLTSDSSLLCGYLVVRKPEWDFDELGRPAFQSSPSVVGSKRYAGLDRLAWHDARDLQISGELSPDAERALDTIDELALVSAVPTRLFAPSYDDAAVLLQASAARSPHNEIIGFFSPHLASRRGVVRASRPSRRLGYDIITAQLSLIHDGYFERPDLFEHWGPSLNAHGLLDAIPDCSAYMTEYLRVAMSGKVEEADMDLEDAFVDWVRIEQMI